MEPEKFIDFVNFYRGLGEIISEEITINSYAQPDGRNIIYPVYQITYCDPETSSVHTIKIDFKDITARNSVVDSRQTPTAHCHVCNDFFRVGEEPVICKQCRRLVHKTCSRQYRDEYVCRRHTLYFIYKAIASLFWFLLSPFYKRGEKNEAVGERHKKPRGEDQ